MERNSNSKSTDNNSFSNPSSWTSTPDLANLKDDTQAVTFSIKLPSKRKPKPIDTGQKSGMNVYDAFETLKRFVFCSVRQCQCSGEKVIYAE